MLLICFMCLIFLAPGDDLALYDSVNLHNTKSDIVRGNTLTLRNASVDTRGLYEMTGTGFRVAGATADMGVFPMEVEAGDSVIITSPHTAFQRRPARQHRFLRRRQAGFLDYSDKRRPCY
jgi:hypothetical protein